LLGVRAVLLDIGKFHLNERTLNMVLTGLGVFIVLYGLWLTFIVIL
jgi:hypothetical protein